MLLSGSASSKIPNFYASDIVRKNPLGYFKNWMINALIPLKVTVKLVTAGFYTQTILSVYFLVECVAVTRRDILPTP